MATGMILAALAFCAATVVEIYVIVCTFPKMHHIAFKDLPLKTFRAWKLTESDISLWPENCCGAPSCQRKPHSGFQSYGFRCQSAISRTHCLLRATKIIWGNITADKHECILLLPLSTRLYTFLYSLLIYTSVQMFSYINTFLLKNKYCSFNLSINQKIES